MKNLPEAVAAGFAAFLALLAAAFAKDSLFQAHAFILMLVLLISSVFLIRRVKIASPGEVLMPADTSGYMDEVVRYGVIATTFWGIVGFLIGVLAASQLAWPDLNIELFD